MSLELALGWSLVHSVWEIAVIGMALLLFLLAARRAKAQIRYAAALMALLACAAAPPATLALLSRPLPQVAALAAVSMERAAPKPESARSMAVATPQQQMPRSIGQRIEPVLPIVVKLWLGGLAMMCARLLGGLVGVRRLKSSGHPDDDGRLQAMAEAIGSKLNLKRPLAILLSKRVEVPTVIGAFKSVILLPASLALRLAPAQIEALLAHEIAHIRRYDYLVNLAQSAVEAVLFYHPVVWWISSVVRREREHCCDDMAIEALGDRTGYTRALVSLEEARSARLALAANGSGLLARVRRIAGAPARPNVAGSIWTACGLGLVLCVLLTQSGLARQTSSKGKTHVIGHVVRAGGGPVAGCTVVCSSRYGFQAPQTYQRQTTDSNGRYDFEVGRDDTWGVTASSKRYGIGSDYSGDRTLKLQPPSTARVQVVDRSGHAVAHIKIAPTQVETDAGCVSLGEMADLYAVETDEQGRATVKGLPVNAKVQFDVLDDNYAIDVSPPYLAAGAVSTIGVQTASRLSGSLTANGQPVPNAQISFQNGWKRMSRRAKTDAQGRFEFSGLPAGPADIGAYISDDWSVTPKALFVSRDRANFALLTAQKTVTVTGHVLSGAGKPLSKCYLMIYRGTAFDHTNIASAAGRNDGSFSANVPPGSYEVMAMTDQARGTQKFAVRADRTASVTVRVPEPTNAAPAMANLHCRLLAPSGRPVHWRAIDFEFRDGKTNLIALGYPHDTDKAVVGVPMTMHWPIQFHCEDMDWESRELTWHPGEVPTIRLHRKAKRSAPFRR